MQAVGPAEGVGVDYSPNMIELARRRHPALRFHVSDAVEFPAGHPFDYILMSDLVNDLPDVQRVLDNCRSHSSSGTRLVLNFFNNLWRPILNLAEKAGAKAPAPGQNWLSTWDMKNLLELSGWQVIKVEPRILWPSPLLGTAPLFNRWLAPLFPHFCLTIFLIARLRPHDVPKRKFRCSVIIPARNEAGNIEPAVQRTPEMGHGTEIIFIEGHSADDTWETLQKIQRKYDQRDIQIMRQSGKGKGNAVREAFEKASGDLLFILDADLTVPPEDLPKFYEVARNGTADFVNGVRLVYPMENQAMRFLNMMANKLFGMTFSWLLGQPVKDTLCGTKVIFRKDYLKVAENRSYFGDFDPFGDFDLLFGAAKLNLRIIDLPIRYKARVYGETNIQRWKHGWLLFQMVLFAARRLKFIRSVSSRKEKTKIGPPNPAPAELEPSKND